MKQILIYRDRGVSPRCLKATVQALHQVHEKFNLAWIDHRALQEKGWQENAVLLIFPGGRDLPYHEALQGLANSNVQAFVNSGGRYLGLCAGGYYGSAYVEFEKANPLEILGSRELKFFSGIARGPAYGFGEFRYETEEGARVVILHLSSESLSAAYYNGGAAFIDAEAHSNVDVIARYHDLEGMPPAIIECRVGKGLAVLSGVHPEYSGYQRHLGGVLSAKLLDELKEIEEERKQLFRDLLFRLLQDRSLL